MKMLCYHTRNSGATQSYKGGQHAVLVYDDGGDVLGVEICASSYQPSRMVRHTCETVPRAFFASLVDNLDFVSEREVDFKMSEVTSRPLGLI